MATNTHSPNLPSSATSADHAKPEGLAHGRARDAKKPLSGPLGRHDPGSEWKAALNAVQMARDAIRRVEADYPLANASGPVLALRDSIHDAVHRAAHDAIESLMCTPAPDQQALLHKIELLAADAISPDLDHMAQLLEDGHRLLSSSPKGDCPN